MKQITTAVVTLLFANLLLAQTDDFKHVRELVSRGECESARSIYNAYVNSTNVSDYGVERLIDDCVSERWYKAGKAEFAKGNYEEAVNWYTKASNMGYATAQYELALCYEKGIGTKRNATEAVKLYRKAAEQQFVEALYSLGDCFFYGIGVDENKYE